VGFGRATSDGIYRAVLWDVVVIHDLEGQGLGRQIVETLLLAAPVASAEKVYLMTTNSQGFYERLGFREAISQKLMLKSEA
jgi:N-acetylglutamate synthase-like GNAT family acetyltransferase